MQDELTEQDKQVVEKRIKRSAEFQRVFQSPEGERVLKEIDTVCGTYKDTFNKDPYVNAFNCGAKSVGLFIHNAIEQDVETARKMLEDASDKTKRNEGTLSE